MALWSILAGAAGAAWRWTKGKRIVFGRHDRVILDLDRLPAGDPGKTAPVVPQGSTKPPDERLRDEKILHAMLQRVSPDAVAAYLAAHGWKRSFPGSGTRQSTAWDNGLETLSVPSTLLEGYERRLLLMLVDLAIAEKRTPADILRDILAMQAAPIPIPPGNSPEKGAK